MGRLPKPTGHTSPLINSSTVANAARLPAMAVPVQNAYLPMELPKAKDKKNAKANQIVSGKGDVAGGDGLANDRTGFARLVLVVGKAPRAPKTKQDK